ncbi:MAG: glucokinase [Caldilineaceae bacterium]|nr:glucokinase [Caldilineaceae bacterium]
MLLAGDIGGTKTNLAVYAAEGGLAAPLAESTFPSRRYDSLEALIEDFREHTHLPFQSAVFGVAGPVVDGKATVTNLPWQIEEKGLRTALGIKKVKLLNDLESIANAVPSLEAKDLQTLAPGLAVGHGPIAIVAPGTGLGEAFLTWERKRYRAHASEGGHASFAPVNKEQWEMLGFLQTKLGHISYERVCSGLGIPNIYAFFKETGRYPEPEWLMKKLAEASDPTPVIVETALAQPECDICRCTLEMFVEILAGEAGNMALKVLATGGVYLGGGIPPRILPVLEDERFLAAFKAKGRFASLLENVPIHVILNPKAGLLGAASYGLARL